MTKARALASLASLWGISPEKLCAVGDGENDLEMLSWAGIGVAMDNAPEKVKEKARCVIASSDEDGVAKFLNKISST